MNMEFLFLIKGKKWYDVYILIFGYYQALGVMLTFISSLVFSCQKLYGSLGKS